MRVRAEVGADGGALELELGTGFPRALAMLMPGHALKNAARLALGGRILDKAHRNPLLDDAEVMYLTEVLGAPEAKLIRQKQVAARARTAFEAAQPSMHQLAADGSANASAAPPGETPSAKTTPEDWLSRFWDDAGLVSDEVLQDIYGRVLASEARAPGTCSLRTLRALRYMDREVAEDFGTVAPLIVRGTGWLPNDLELLRSFNITYSVITNCVEAGLMMAPNSDVATLVPAGRAHFQLGRRIIGLTLENKASIPIIPLTLAGRELYRVAQVEPQQDQIARVVQWLMEQCSATSALSAPLPSADFEGSAESLEWRPIEE